MDRFLYFSFGFGYSGLFIWGFLLAKKFGLKNVQNLVLFVLLGLIYDNLMIGFGSIIGEGKTLESLSHIRYWMHAIFTPSLILFAWSVCNRAGLAWAQRVKWAVLTWLLTIGLILYELFTSVMPLKLEAKWKNGVLAYESAGQPENPIMVIVITLFLLIAGFQLLKKERFPWLFVGTITMIAGSFFAFWKEESPLINSFEFVLMLSLLITKRFQDSAIMKT